MNTFQSTPLADTAGSSFQFNTYLKHKEAPGVLGQPGVQEEVDGIVHKKWTFTERSTGAVVSISASEDLKDESGRKDRFLIRGLETTAAWRFKREVEHLNAAKTQ